jgi:cytochrome c553
LPAVFRLIPAAIVLLLGAALPSARAADAGLDFFEKKVRPVLAEHCLKCHSVEGKKQRGGLALDSRAGLLKGGDSGPALVAGKPNDSLLVKAVRYSGELRMPPKGKLPETVIADLEQWVALGAPDPRDGSNPVIAKKGINIEEGRQFWAFQPPRRQALPAVKDAAWPRTDVDRFLRARLEARGLNPAGDADPRVLVRRLYFDLIGLPPTPEAVDAFVQSATHDPQSAIERVVDRLLASPHFGERWGRYWLDLARYAESSGGGRSLLFKDAWRYRDYVIDAFNRDKPYNRFLVEQLAGDLLPYATPEERAQQLLATAFLVLGPTNYERQDKDILETDVIDEQLDTIGRTVLGMTIGCARCHDHKFDPIPQKDYYALAGILRSTQTLIHDNVSRWVEQPLPMSPEEEAAWKKHEAATAALKEKIRIAKEAEKKSGKSAAARGVVAVKDLPGLVLDDQQAKKVGAWTLSKYSGSYIGDGYLHDGNTGKGEKTLTFVPDFPQAGRYEVRLAYTAGTNRATKVPVHILHLDGEFTGHVNMQQAPPIDGRFVSLGTFRFDTSGQWYVIISNEGTTGHVIVDAVQFLPEEMVRALKAEAKASPGKNVPAPAPDSKKLEEELKKLSDSAPRPMAMCVTEAAKIGDFYVCIRGNLHNRGEPVPRGFLQVLRPAHLREPAIPANESGRRQLAAWLAGADNPLTARVMVNRLWHHLFGAGIVRTVDTFGTTGEWPSHPELLDHLAIQFVQEGWSIKKLIRSLVLSRAYQLSAAASPEARAADAENRLFGRRSRRRLDAEVIRDAILAVSGRLDRTVGGPTWKPNTISEYGYVFDDTRRSVYTPVFRNRLVELFEVFDFADPNLVIGRRNISTVATQALYMLNSPFVMEQARHAARRALAGPERDDAARLERAYREALGRRPTAREKELALGFVCGKEGEARKKAWERVYQALFACIDFRYVE